MPAPIQIKGPYRRTRRHRDAIERLEPWVCVAVIVAMLSYGLATGG